MSLQDGPETLTISPSRIAVYRACPKQYHYQYVLSLAKKQVPKKHFDKGNYFHELCHVYYRLLQEGVKPGSITAVEIMRNRIREDIQQNITTANYKDKLQVYDTITKQFLRYITERSPEIDDGITVLGVEEEIKVPVELPSGRIIFLHGFIDLRYKDANGIYRIRDHKTGQKKWDETDISLTNQLLHYGAAIFVMTGLLHRVEINFILTKDYKTKNPTYNETFQLISEPHSEVTIQNYLDTTLQLIDDMLDSKPIPHYDERVCKYCHFKEPCIGERRGIDSSRILATNYVTIDRSKHRERSFTDQDSNGDIADPIS